MSAHRPCGHEDSRALKWLVGWFASNPPEGEALEVLTELHEMGAWSAAGLLDWCAECNGTGEVDHAYIIQVCPECKGETHDTARGRA